VERLGESFNGKRLGEITPFLVEKHKKKRLDAGRRVSANRELSCLHTIFNRCRDWGKYEGENPVAKVKLLKEPKGRVRYLGPTEEAKLLEKATEPRLRTIIIAGIHAGLRIAFEALTLRPQSVSLERGSWGRWGFLAVEAAYAKSGKTRTVPLNSTLHDAFANYFKATGDDGDFVFANEEGRPFRSVRSAFRTACKNAGLKGVTPHTLRHTFAKPARHGRRRSTDGPGARRLGEPQDGRALFPPLPKPPGRSDRANRL
jgi:integrase